MWDKTEVSGIWVSRYESIVNDQLTMRVVCGRLTSAPRDAVLRAPISRYDSRWSSALLNTVQTAISRPWNRVRQHAWDKDNEDEDKQNV